MALDAGSRIAQYRLERKLGAGGMGEVYLARDEKLNRLVAIKLLTAADEGAKKRLAREARAAAGLDHPGICAVYEVGSDEAVGDFIAMQYIEGETLAARLRRGRMTPDEAMNIGAQIAEALVAAHRHGLVHRDLKPQNVIITPTGSARLLDFGLAMHVPTTTEAANAVTSSRVTDPNTVLGTPSYMSPEQVRNEPADFRTDVFSLGCVMYECLTGHRAFGGATTAEVLGAILHLEPPPVSSVVPNIGPAYDALCARMLDKIPSERFHSAEEALGAIRALTPSLHFSTKSLRVPVRRRRNRLMQLVAVAVVAVGGLFAWQWYQRLALPVPTPEAERWYREGVEAMRDGAFLGARSKFSEAIARFEGYAQAYSRLAEANTALEDENAAQQALLKVSQLAPNRSRWPKEEQLRFDAASAASLRQYAASITAYQQLVDMKKDDPGRWVDLGRAQEASPLTPRSVPMASYQKAVQIDPEFAAGLLRLGVLQVRFGQREEGLKSIDQAIHFYSAGSRTEGEAEAQLRKGIAFADAGRNDAARAGLLEVFQLTSTKRFPSQHIRAQFFLTRLDYAEGRFTDAEERANQAVKAAVDADLPLLSAAGLVDLGVTLFGRRRYEDADPKYEKAIEIAKEKGSKRLEMRARLQQASNKLQLFRPAEAFSLADEPYKYFLKTEDVRLLNDAKAILSRAHEALEHYPEARTLAEEVLKFGESANDAAVEGLALESLAGQLQKVGNLPEALKYRARLDLLQKDAAAYLILNLANHAEVLILLGRRAEAEGILRQIDKGIADGVEAFVLRRSRVAHLRALFAATERRWNDVIRFAEAVEAAETKPGAPAAAKPSPTVMYSRILAEHAASQLGRSRTAIDVIAAWPAQSVSLYGRREWTFWVAQTLITRGEAARAEAAMVEALSAPGVQANSEQGWRLAAVAALAARNNPASSGRSTLAARTSTAASELEKAWGPADAATYFARLDLAALRKDAR